jgi:predicted metal-dependent TIM-barrel fold hydrolase
MPKAPQLLGELSEAAGYREGQSNLTVIVINHTSDDMIEQVLEKEVYIYIYIYINKAELIGFTTIR